MKLKFVLAILLMLLHVSASAHIYQREITIVDLSQYLAQEYNLAPEQSKTVQILSETIQSSTNAEQISQAIDAISLLHPAHRSALLDETIGYVEKILTSGNLNDNYGENSDTFTLHRAIHALGMIRTNESRQYLEMMIAPPENWDEFLPQPIHLSSHLTERKKQALFNQLRFSVLGAILDREESITRRLMTPLKERIESFQNDPFQQELLYYLVLIVEMHEGPDPSE